MGGGQDVLPVYHGAATVVVVLAQPVPPGQEGNKRVGPDIGDFPAKNILNKQSLSALSVDRKPSPGFLKSIF